MSSTHDLVCDSEVRTVSTDPVSRGDRLATELMLAGGGGAGTREPGGWQRVLQATIRDGFEDTIARVAVRRANAGAPPDVARLSFTEAVLVRASGDCDGATERVARAVDVAAGLPEFGPAAALFGVPGRAPAADRDTTVATVIAVLHGARCALDRESVDVALDRAETAVDLCGTAGLRGFGPYALSLRARALAGLGRLDDALLDALLAERGQGTADRVYGLLTLGTVHRRRRDGAGARAALDAALKFLPGDVERAALAPAVLAELARTCARDDAAVARGYADRSVATATGGGRRAALLARGWVALAAGDLVTAAADAAAVRAAARTDSCPASTGEAWELQALAAGSEGATREGLREAVMAYRQVPDVAGEAVARVVGTALRRGPGHQLTPADHELLRGHGILAGRGVADALTVVLGRGPRIVVQALGGFRVVRDDEEVKAHEWQSRKARDLLRILVCSRGGPVPRARLMELLWPGLPSAAGGRRLSVQLSVLRRALAVTGPGRAVDPLVADRRTVSLNTDVVAIDAERFLGAAREALVAFRGGAANTPDLLALAEDLHTGEFMPDEPYATWTYELRDEVDAVYGEVLRARAASVPDFDHRTSCLRRILARDPYDEGAHLELVTELRRAGRHGEARRRYDLYLASMREIGVSPAVRREQLGTR